MDEAEIDRSRRVVLTHRPPLVAGSPMGRRQTSHPLDRHRQRRRGWSIAGALVTGALMAWMSDWVWMGSVPGSRTPRSTPPARGAADVLRRDDRDR